MTVFRVLIQSLQLALVHLHNLVECCKPVKWCLYDLTEFLSASNIGIRPSMLDLADGQPGNPVLKAIERICANEIW